MYTLAYSSPKYFLVNVTLLGEDKKLTDKKDTLHNTDHPHGPRLFSFSHSHTLEAKTYVARFACVTKITPTGRAEGLHLGYNTTTNVNKTGMLLF